MRKDPSPRRHVRLKHLHYAFTHTDADTQIWMMDEGAKRSAIRAVLFAKAQICAIAAKKYRFIGKSELKDRVKDHHFNGNPKFLTWLRNVARTDGGTMSIEHLIRIYRKACKDGEKEGLRRQKVRPRTQAIGSNFELADRRRDFLADVMAEDLAAFMRGEIAARPDRYKVFGLRIIEGRSVEEVARMLETSKATVRRALTSQCMDLLQRFARSLGVDAES